MSNLDAHRPPRMIGGGNLLEMPAAYKTALTSMFPYGVEDYDGRRGRSLERYLERAGLTLEELFTADIILDLGAGPEARFRDELAEAAKKAGVSPLPHVISVSLGYADPEIRKNLIEKTGSAEGVVAADVEKLPFRDGTFTKIVAVHLFTHLTEEKLRGAVAEVERILAPNGTLVIVPVLVPKEKGDYTFDLTQAEADNLKIRAMEDTWVRRSVHLSGLISQQFAGKGKVTMSDLTPEIGSETQLYKLRRITAEKGE
ncbi:MAG: class I SAM-dependent methyltransferase [Patescibacteria group bacterium]